jgi:ELWxxDGT repeat protein
VLFQGKLWFFAADHLWRTDGTAAGTVAVGPRLRWIDWPTVYRGRLWFMSSEYDAPGTWLWSTDGTDSGTVPAIEVAASFPDLLTDGERLYISIRTSDPQQAGLWVSDGTAAGTRRVSDRAVCRNWGDSTPESKWTAFGGLLVYSSDPDCALAVSDGTAAGSRILQTADGHVLKETARLLPFGSHVLVLTGKEIWQTDGTDAGTTTVLKPTEWPVWLDWVRAGDRVFFPFHDAETGVELWAIRE